jgi:hypothetical protein
VVTDLAVDNPQQLSAAEPPAVREAILEPRDPSGI